MNKGGGLRKVNDVTPKRYTQQHEQLRRFVAVLKDRLQKQRIKQKTKVNY
jgi:hypothetical protein